MPRYHVKVIHTQGVPELFLARLYRDFYDGPFTDSFEGRLTFARPEGANRRIAIEVDRQPNEFYGHLTFEVVEEPD